MFRLLTRQLKVHSDSATKDLAGCVYTSWASSLRHDVLASQTVSKYLHHSKSQRTAVSKVKHLSLRRIPALRYTNAMHLNNYPVSRVLKSWQTQRRNARSARASE